jgi:hypothetical protein
MQAYLGLTTWPDVPSALRSLQEAGVRLAFLSNMTAKMLEAGIKHPALEGIFEHVLSTDQVRARGAPQRTGPWGSHTGSARSGRQGDVRCPNLHPTEARRRRPVSAMLRLLAAPDAWYYA